MSASRQFAIVTGASTGIGLELAKCCAREGFDLLIAADEPEIESRRTNPPPRRVSRRSKRIFRPSKASTSSISGDRAAAGRRAARQCGPGAWARVPRSGFRRRPRRDRHQHYRHALPHPQSRPRHARRKVRAHPDHRFDRRIYARQFQAVYNGSKAFLDRSPSRSATSCETPRVTVTCLMPGATETEFFERADMMDTTVGTAKKDDAAFCRQARLRRDDGRAKATSSPAGRTRSSSPRPT